MRRRFLVGLVLIASPSSAQEAEIVVTGRGLERPIGESVYDAVEIDRDTLTGSASNRLDEVLRQVPGFQLFRRSDARSANPTSQGATLRALGGNASSRALLLLDGVPQTDPFGGWISWPGYDPQRLGSVRVVRGGGTGANGPGALAGTIELTSAEPRDITGAAAALAYGSRDSIDGHAGIGLKLGQGFVTLSGAYGRGDGFIPIIEAQRGPIDRPSPYEQASAAVRAVAPLGSGVELQANGLVFVDERERGTALSDIETKGADASLRLVGPRWSALAYVQRRNFYNSFASANEDRTAVNRVAEQYDVPSTGLGARFELRPALRPFELRVGGDWRETVGETRELFNFQNGVGTRRRKAGGRTRTIGLFAEAAREIGPVTLSGGARLDRWWVLDGFLDEKVIATDAVLTDTDFADRDGWEPTGRAGAAWRASDRLTLRAAGYLGWRLPTLNELYRPFRVGADATAANAELEPERLKGVEAGLEYRPAANSRVAVTAFANRLQDGIANVTLARGPGVFPGVGFVSAAGEYRQRRNLDAIISRGIEIDASVDLGRWRLSGGYSFADAEVKASGAALPLDGLRPAQTPRHLFSGTVGWQDGKGMRAAVTARYAGSQFEDDLNQQRMPDALTFDGVIALPVTRHLILEGRAENVTDGRVVTAISGDGIVERATPRTLWVGLRLRD